MDGLDSKSKGTLRPTLNFSALMTLSLSLSLILEILGDNTTLRLGLTCW